MCPRFIFVASNCLATLSFLIREDLPLWLQAASSTGSQFCRTKETDTLMVSSPFFRMAEILG
jgi:hypothetical protein